MVRMYHPSTGATHDVPDDEAAAVLAESGWLPAPEPEARPGYEPEPVTYAPVKTKSKTKPSAEPADGDPGGHD